MIHHLIPLDIFNIRDIRRLEKRKDAVLSYYYKHYSFLLNERSKIIEQLKASLSQQCISYQFQHWHRVITFRYSENPLSAKGSLLNDPGGRFNIGDLDRLKYPAFPALYIAEDFETAYREKFQLKPSDNINGLSTDELALNKIESIADIIVQGDISIVLDLTKPKTLTEFFNVINTIKIPHELIKEARQLNVPTMHPIQSLKALRESIIDEHWRRLPMQVDIPANSQILGQIAQEAKVEAILYSSKMRSNKKCLAIFTNNFQNSPSSVCIKDKTPEQVKYKCLNSDTYTQLQ